MSDNENFGSDIDDDVDFDDDANVDQEVEEEEEKDENSEYEECKNDEKSDDDVDAIGDDDDDIYDEDTNQYNVDDCLYKNAKPKKKSYVIEEPALLQTKKRLHGMIIVNKEDRITGNRMTDYEIVRILGTRMRQFQLGAPALIETVSSERKITTDSSDKIDLEELAKMELIALKTPLIIARPMPNNYVEPWYISEMVVPSTLWG
jgi:DNA-directed RNA polymerase subunit K/omega